MCTRLQVLSQNGTGKGYKSKQQGFYEEISYFPLENNSEKLSRTGKSKKEAG